MPTDSTNLQIRLSAAGITLAGGGTLQISALGKSFSFTAGVAQPVTADDWTWLRTRPDPISGAKLFELVPVPAQPAPAAKAPAAGPVPVPAKPAAAPAEASLEPTKETSGK